MFEGLQSGILCFAVMVNRENISVHAVFISKTAGEILKVHARGEEGECCIFPLHNGTAWTVLAISFISFLVILAILIVAIFIPRQWLHSQGRNHLPKSVDSKMVEALPCFVFSSAHLGDLHAGETCAICLEDYKDGEILKVLPCHHGRNFVPITCLKLMSFSLELACQFHCATRMRLSVHLFVYIPCVSRSV